MIWTLVADQPMRQIGWSDQPTQTSWLVRLHRQQPRPVHAWENLIHQISMRAAYRHSSSARAHKCRVYHQDEDGPQADSYLWCACIQHLGSGRCWQLLSQATAKLQGASHPNTRPSGITLGSARAYINIGNRIPGSRSLLPCLETPTACHPRPYAPHQPM